MAKTLEVFFEPADNARLSRLCEEHVVYRWIAGGLVDEFASLTLSVALRR